MNEMDDGGDVSIISECGGLSQINHKIYGHFWCTCNVCMCVWITKTYL